MPTDMNVNIEDESVDSRENLPNSIEETCEIDTKSEKGIYLLNLNYANERFYALAPKDVEVIKGDLVIVPTKYGVDVARVCGEVQHDKKNVGNNFVVIIRKATLEDINKLKKNRELEEGAEKIFKERVQENNLDMKFIKAHILLEETKIIFFFSADGRVDFRMLVKDLVGIFKIRVELRQIGVRDETRFVGGMAPCGRVFCCASLTDKMEPVSIKMARDEGLSLNSNRISGHCGRLLCCLAYEHQHYVEVETLLPPRGVKITYNGLALKMLETNRVTSMVSLISDDGQSITVPLSRIKKIDEVWKIV